MPEFSIAELESGHRKYSLHLLNLFLIPLILSGRLKSHMGQQSSSAFNPVHLTKRADTVSSYSWRGILSLLCLVQITPKETVRMIKTNRFFGSLGCVSKKNQTNYRAEGNLQAKLYIKRYRCRSEVLSLSTHSGLKKKDVGWLLFG